MLPTWRRLRMAPVRMASRICASETAPKVRKATNQPGAVPADLTAAGKQALDGIFAWRLVSFDSAGAVGDFGVIERVNQA